MADDEWYTPEWLVDSARFVLGGIDIDPASCEEAQRTVKADEYMSAADNALGLPWRGRVFLNPPYSRGLIGEFVINAITEHHLGNVTDMIVLTNAATDTAWAQMLLGNCAAVCFLRGRVKFIGPGGAAGNSPRYPQMVTYFGMDSERFEGVFDEHGNVFRG